jgi:hypothetical protein
LETNFVPTDIYEEIVNALGKWKVLDVKNLKEMIDPSLSYFNFLKKIRILEKNGILKSVLIGRKNKHVYLSAKGLKFTPLDCSSEIAPENLTHDLIVSRVLKELLKHPSFDEGRMFHHIDNKKILPDAELVGIKNGESYRLGIEVELTQKTYERVTKKFKNYRDDINYDYSFFVTNKESLFKTYCKLASQMDEDVQRSNIIVLDKSLSRHKFNYQSSDYYYLNKLISFNDLFLDTGQKT